MEVVKSTHIQLSMSKKKLDTISICRSTLCVNNDVENSMKFRVNPLDKDSSKQL